MNFGRPLTLCVAHRSLRLLNLWVWHCSGAGQSQDKGKGKVLGVFCFLPTAWHLLCVYVCVKTQGAEFPWRWDERESESCCGLGQDRSFQPQVCGKHSAPACLPTAQGENEK